MTAAMQVKTGVLTIVIISTALWASTWVGYAQVRPGGKLENMAPAPFSKKCPVTGSKKTDLGHSRSMRTSLRISCNGRLDAVTRTWTAEALRGFTGGVFVAYMDWKKNVLGTSQDHSYGVNGTAVPGADSDTTRKWSEQIPPDVLEKLSGYAIFHVNDPKSRWRETMAEAEEFAKRAKADYEELKSGS